MSLQKYFLKIKNWIIFCLLIISIPWLADLVLIIYGGSNKTINFFISPSFEEVLISAFLLSLFTLITFATAFLSSRSIKLYSRSETIVSNYNIDAACKSLLPVFFVLNLIFLFDAIQYGLFDALLAFRIKTKKIGFFAYFILLFYPIIIAVTWRYNNYIINFTLLLLMIFSNLITGFRILLIGGLILIFIYNHHHFLRNNVKKILIFITLLVVIFIVYENFRSAWESVGMLPNDNDRTIFDSLARSVPITYISIALRDRLVLDWTVFFGILIEPFKILVSQIIPITMIESPSLLVSEPLARGYLIWRGTPDSEATGFSVHVLAQAFLFNGIVGVMLFSILIGILLGLGARLIQSNNNSNRLFGTLYLTFVISCSEAFSHAWTLLTYWILFVFILIIYARIVPILIPRKNVN
jgi:hypothetical protein